MKRWMAVATAEDSVVDKNGAEKTIAMLTLEAADRMRMKNAGEVRVAYAGLGWGCALKVVLKGWVLE